MAEPKLLGYARVSTTHQSIDQQQDALAAAGVDTSRDLYVDKLSGTTRREQRAGLDALLSYARDGDVIVVTAVDRLGRTTVEVMSTVRDLLEQGIVIRVLNAGVDSSTPIGRAVFTILAGFAELELELGKERRLAAREARRARGQHIGRPKALTASQRETVVAEAARGKPVAEIAKDFKVGRDTVYRVLKAANDEEADGNG